jgi:hypothetical protein
VNSQDFAYFSSIPLHWVVAYDLGSANLPSSDFDLFGAVTKHFSNAKQTLQMGTPNRCN